MFPIVQPTEIIVLYSLHKKNLPLKTGKSALNKELRNPAYFCSPINVLYSLSLEHPKFIKKNIGKDQNNNRKQKCHL